MVRVFANGPGDLGSISRSSHTKDSKMVLDASLLNTQHYKVRIMGKVKNPGKGVAPSPTLWCSSYRKGSLWVTLDNGRQLYFIFIGYAPWSHCRVMRNSVAIVTRGITPPFRLSSHMALKVSKNCHRIFFYISFLQENIQIRTKWCVYCLMLVKYFLFLFQDGTH